MYSDINAQVKWKGQMSNRILDKQGLRQGAPMSVEALNRRNDKIIIQISSIHDYPKIGTHPINAVMVADDLAIISSSRDTMQQAIKIAENHASQERYLFSDTKNRTVRIPAKPIEKRTPG